jgi:hypothetical protein
MGRKRDSIPMLDGDKWCGMVQRKIWDEFYDTYAAELEQFDGFITCYPPLFAYLYKRFKKPIIINIPIRYEYPCQSSADDWNAFNDFLIEGIDEGRYYLVANNIYDQKYTELFLNRKVEYIPSLCEYTKAIYKPTRDEVLYYFPCSIDELDPVLFRRKHEALPFGHTWQDVANFKAVVHFPYNVSTMSTFEHYMAGIPILCPHREFALELYRKKYRIMEQNSWVSTFGRPAGSVIKRDWPLGFDPNDYTNEQSMNYWMHYADYWNNDAMPDIIHFDSFQRLHQLARSLQWNVIHNMMMKTNEKRKTVVYTRWGALLERIKNDHHL